MIRGQLSENCLSMAWLAGAHQRVAIPTLCRRSGWSPAGDLRLAGFIRNPYVEVTDMDRV